MGLTTPPLKKGSVTETRTDSQPLLSTLGEDGDSDSAPELMMTRGESRKNLSDWTLSSSARSLRIASWNVRTLYEAGKCVQATREMQRYRLDILGVSETHWIQSGQKKLRSGELVLFSGKEEGIHEEGVAIILSKRAQRTLRGWEAHGSRSIYYSCMHQQTPLVRRKKRSFTTSCRE